MPLESNISKEYKIVMAFIAATVAGLFYYENFSMKNEQVASVEPKLIENVATPKTLDF